MASVPYNQQYILLYNFDIKHRNDVTYRKIIQQTRIVQEHRLSFFRGTFIWTSASWRHKLSSLIS